ncbi:MAG: 6-bladed beta-propeller, partial [Thermodesulfobacteriota bacterium]
AVDADGTVYVADADNDRVQYFTAKGEFLGTWGTYGFGEGQFNNPAALAVSPDGKVYVVECNGARVQSFVARAQ